MVVTKRFGDQVVEIAPYGPDSTQVAAIRRKLLSGPLAPFLVRAKHRWMSFKLDDELDGPLPALPDITSRFRATLYDYTNERTVQVDGTLDDLDSVDVTFSSFQPPPIRAEWLAAVDMLRHDPLYGPLLRTGALRTYRPMPPYVEARQTDGSIRRAVTVGLHRPPTVADAVGSSPLDGGESVPDFAHRVVAMTMATAEIYADYVGGFPENTNCGGVPRADECPESASAGQATVVTRDAAGEELWRLIVVPPAGSSGTLGSGVELRHVSYRERPVLRRAHVPLVNVLYLLAKDCGPSYRDWLNEESCFQAPGTDIADGVRLCTERPQTLLELGQDEGNFRGVAVYLDDGALLLVTELQAGWYRYPMEWRLEENGQIRARFGFGAVANPCTCQSHVHHAYFRFDFGSADSRVEEFNDPPIDERDSEVHLIEYETPRLHDADRNRHWRITDAADGRGYRLVPGANDGAADLYGAGDAWFLRYWPDEIDDGQGFTEDPALSRARLDLWADGESINGEEVVVWYGGHFIHDPGTSGRYVGPVLAPLPG